MDRAGVEFVQQYFRGLTLPTWSVYSLRDMHGGWVSHASEGTSPSTGGREQLESLTLSYFNPTDRRQCLVRSEAVRPLRSPLALNTLVEWVIRGDLDEQPVDEQAGVETVGTLDETVTVLIDSQPTSAVLHRVGDAGGIRCLVDGVWVTVLFRRLQVDAPLPINRLTDLRPLQEQRGVIVRELLSRHVN